MIDTVLTVVLTVLMFTPLALVLFQWVKPNWHRAGLDLTQLLVSMFLTVVFAIFGGDTRWTALLWLAVSWVCFIDWTKSRAKAAEEVSA